MAIKSINIWKTPKLLLGDRFIVFVVIQRIQIASFYIQRRSQFIVRLPWSQNIKFTCMCVEEEACITINCKMLMCVLNTELEENKFQYYYRHIKILHINCNYIKCHFYGLKNTMYLKLCVRLEREIFDSSYFFNKPVSTF